MHGWNGKLLWVDLAKGKAIPQKYDAEFAKTFLGGRGFAAKILWDQLRRDVDPLSPENLLIFTAGPLTAFSLPSSGKLLVAAKSPLTGGYGDGNIGTQATVQMRRAGYDGIVISGKASKPTILYVNDNETEFVDARDYWGDGTFKTERRLKKEYSTSTGIVSIGQAGENKVKFANVISQEGRGGGRPGMGAVMGSKKLKAVAIRGTKTLPAKDPEAMRKLGVEAYGDVLAKPNFDFWKRQGTMITHEWSQENSCLPTYNFREGVFEKADLIGGFAMEKIKIGNRGCPNCNMTCGNIVEDSTKQSSELDYENVAMLGSNIGLGNLKELATLNRLADDYGVDTISLGNAVGFAIEASEKGLIDYNIEWGNFEEAKILAENIVFKREEMGALLAEGVRSASEKVGGNSAKWAMQIKGLEISGYDCHATPGMALSYATCSIGAHHKDAWIISWEVSAGRENYGKAKVDKVIELQRLRGGIFECFTTCRLPWVEVGFDLGWYPKFLKAATGLNITMNDLFTIADRAFNLIRAFWVREYAATWNRSMDTPPARWFDEPITNGPLKGSHLDREKYEHMLQTYYRERGWDTQGIPTKATLKRLGLDDVSQELQLYVNLTPS
jgi:aldehyde:ferredoxin oxidoreductase